MKRSIFLYGFLAVFCAGSAGIAAAASMGAFQKPVTQTIPVILDGLFGKKEQEQQQQVWQHAINNDETFDAVKKTHEILPFERVELSVAFDLPNDWQGEVFAEGKNYELSQKILGDIAIFKSPLIGTARGVVTIHALTLEHEISAGHWLKNYILANGFSPDGELVAKSNTSASAYYINIEKGISMHTYIGAHISGNTMVLIRFVIPLDLKDYVTYLQKRIIDSFHLTYPKDSAIEQQKVFTMVDSIKFNYPESWLVVSPDFRDMNKLTVQLHNKDSAGVAQGFIRIVAVRRNRSTDLDREIQSLRAYFKDTMKLEFQKMEYSGKSQAYDRFVFNRTEKYLVSNPEKPDFVQRINLVVLGDKEWYILMFLLSPREEEDLYNSARNEQSFDVLIKSIK
jgi:hypothetical protein